MMSSSNLLSPQNKQNTSNSPQDILDSQMSFANITSKKNLNPMVYYTKKQLLVFNGVPYNMNLNTPRTLNACMELGISKEAIDYQLKNFENIVKPAKNELPEITQMKTEHQIKRIAGKIFLIIGSYIKMFV